MDQIYFKRHANQKEPSPTATDTRVFGIKNRIRSLGARLFNAEISPASETKNALKGQSECNPLLSNCHSAFGSLHVNCDSPRDDGSSIASSECTFYSTFQGSPLSVADVTGHEYAATHGETRHQQLPVFEIASPLRSKHLTNDRDTDDATSPETFDSASVRDDKKASDAVGSSTETGADMLLVDCRVCGNEIDVTGKSLSQLVVQCTFCQEATPIMPAPAGKCYVRCSCNCLFICSAFDTRTACPRKTCGRLVALTTSGSFTDPTFICNLSGKCCIECAYCRETFVDNAESTLVECSACGRTSTLDENFRSRKLKFFAIVHMAFLMLALLLPLSTLLVLNFVSVILSAAGALFLLPSLFALFRCWYYCRMRISSMECCDNDEAKRDAADNVGISLAI